MTNEDDTATSLHQLPGEAEPVELYKHLHFSDKPEIRERAAELLGNLADSGETYDEGEVVKQLIKVVITDEDIDVRARAIDSLYLHGEENIDYLVNELVDAVKQGAREEGVAEFFVEWLGASHPEFRLVAATALRRVDDERVLSPLRRVFDDPDPRVRASAVEAYSLVSDSVDITPIRSKLKDRDPKVRQAAATALGNVGTDEALSGLAPAVNSSNERLRTIAVDQLGEWDNRKAATVLLRAVSDRSESVRRTAMRSLIKLFAEGDAVQGQEIRRLLIEQTDPEDVLDVADILCTILDETVGRNLRRNAVWLLGGLVETGRQESIAELLVQFLDDRDDAVADIAAASLRQLTDDMLEKRLRLFRQNEDHSERARERAASILEEIRQDTKTEMESQSIEYTYVSDPSDYTSKRNRNGSDTG